MVAKQALEHIAYKMRTAILSMTTVAGSGHPTSALSAVEIVATLFFHVMRIDLRKYDNPNNDRFILSKGHASPVLYAVFKELGLLTQDDILQYRQFNSPLEGHPTPRFMWSEAATGSLGQGLSIGAGMALSARMDKRDFKTYVLMGDSETSEGSVWEAVEIAAHYKLNNLIGIVDCNRLGQTTQTLDGYDLERYECKFKAFGWHTLVVDGHDVAQLMQVFDKAVQLQDAPVVIIAKTVKGYGVKQAENKEGFHGKVFDKNELPALLHDLYQRFKQAADYQGALLQPTLPTPAQKIPHAVSNVVLPQPPYQSGGKEVMTRFAYGQTLAALGKIYPSLIVLDAEVNNSTYAQLFQKDFPDRFVQCFIAEQNMVSMAVGMHKRGKIPFCSTFAAFFTRAYDQIRMAAVGAAALRLVGSHAGVSIGQDGPSQMGLEDIAMMRTIHDSCVLYSSDAISTWKLVQQMAAYDQGITYLRTTRTATPVIYDQSQNFVIGGCKVIMQSKQDRCCLVAAGITLHEAIKAYQQLAQEGIFVSVIDLYSIKPLDGPTVAVIAHASGKKIITVEDHYLEGGLGQAVVCALEGEDIAITCMAVHKMPRSGLPEDLLAHQDIDAAAIVKKVKQLLR